MPDEYGNLTDAEWAKKREAVVRRERVRQRARENPGSAAARERKAAARRERYYAQPAIVYRLTFPDGAVYFGTTVQDLKTRLAGHRNKCTVVGRRLDMGEVPVADIMREFHRDDRDQAVLLEAELMAQVPPLLRLNLRRPSEDVIIQSGGDPGDIAAFAEDPSLLGVPFPPVDCPVCGQSVPGDSGIGGRVDL